MKHETKPLNLGQEYFSPSIASGINYQVRHWKGSDLDVFMLNHDQVYLNKEDAINHQLEINKAIQKREEQRYKNESRNSKVKKGDTLFLEFWGKTI